MIVKTHAIEFFSSWRSTLAHKSSEIADPSDSVSALLSEEESSRDFESEKVLPVLFEDLEVFR